MDHVIWLQKGISDARAEVFLAGIWWIWRARNLHSIQNEIMHLHLFTSQAYNLAGFIQMCFMAPAATTRPQRWVAWHPQSLAATILNVDGSCVGNLRRPGFGGVLRHEDGQWITGFARHLGVSNNLYAEIMALYQGLNLAWNLGYQDLQCYIDYINVLSLL